MLFQENPFAVLGTVHEIQPTEVTLDDPFKNDEFREKFRKTFVDKIKEIPIIFENRTKGKSKIPKIETLRTLKNIFLLFFIK